MVEPEVVVEVNEPEAVLDTNESAPVSSNHESENSDKIEDNMVANETTEVKVE